MDSKMYNTDINIDTFRKLIPNSKLIELANYIKKELSFEDLRISYGLTEDENTYTGMIPIVHEISILHLNFQEESEIVSLIIDELRFPLLELIERELIKNGVALDNDFEIVIINSIPKQETSTDLYIHMNIYYKKK